MAAAWGDDGSPRKCARLSGEEPDAASVATECRLREEVCALRRQAVELRSEVGEARGEARQQSRRAELHSGREAEAVARLAQRCEHLEADARACRAKAQEMEAKLVEAEADRDGLRLELSDELHRAREREAELRGELASARASGSASPAPAPEAAPAPEVPRADVAGDARARAAVEEAEALRQQVKALEGEVSSLRLALDDVAQDRQLAARLREQHAAYEEELRELRRVSKELSEVQAQFIVVEQAREALEAALRAREAELEKAQEGARQASAAQKALDAYSAVALSAVSKAEGEPEGTPGPMQLSLVLARLQTEVATLRRERVGLQQELEATTRRQHEGELDAGRLRSEAAAAAARVEELQVDLRRAKDEAATHEARVQVLREAVSRSAAGGAGAAAATSPPPPSGQDEDAASRLQAAQRRADALEALAKSRERALEAKCREAEQLQAQRSRCEAAEARARRLEEVNAELWSSNRELEQLQGRLVAELEQRDAELQDFDPKTTKILHLARGPDGQIAAGSRGSDSSVAGPGVAQASAQDRPQLKDMGAGSALAQSSGDMQRRQAEKQLDRFKKATRKYVQDFREGIYGLLGWKVEMKGEGSAMRWHLVSRYGQEGRELVFQLRPPEPGRPPEFDLLATEWAEQLQGDRQAMAFLEVYSSVPGFLAAVTGDLVGERGVPG